MAERHAGFTNEDDWDQPFDGEFTIKCSCGADLRARVLENDFVRETRVKDAAEHIYDGHSIDVGGKAVNMATIAAHQQTYMDPR